MIQFLMLVKRFKILCIWKIKPVDHTAELIKLANTYRSVNIAFK